MPGSDNPCQEVAAILPQIVKCVGLPLRETAILTLTHVGAGTYCKAVFAAPADLGNLMAYSTYAARMTKLGASMARFGVDLERWQVEVVFSVVLGLCGENGK